MTKRLFTFGCSFTQYVWPTWADILGRGFDHYENWGHVGAGNEYIFHSLVECNLLNKFCPDDTIIIMWSSPDRVDVYKNNVWHLTGSLFNNSLFDKDYIIKYHDTRGSQMKSLSFIEAASNILKYTNANYEFLSMIPIHNNVDNLYNNTTSYIKKSFTSSIENTDSFYTVDDDKKHLDYVREHYHEIKGVDWPTWENFLNEDYTGIKDTIIKEIIDFDVRTTLNNKPTNDPHFSSGKHLEYLDIVLPEYSISNETREWIKNYKYRDPFDPHLPKERL